MGFLKVFFITLFMSVSAFAVPDTTALATEFNKDTGDFDHLKSLVAKNELKSVEEFLTLWKQERPKFYSNYIMAYRSRSLQAATPQNPRVVMFNGNADLILSFNGHPQQKGFESVEVVRFNHDRDGFEFYEMNFNGIPRAGLEKANSAKCLSCHQSWQRTVDGESDPRPNWESYSSWPGFYGSLSDDTSQLAPFFFKKEHFDPIKDRVLAEDIHNEDAWYAEFINHLLPLNPRYSLLMPIEKSADFRETLNSDFTNRISVLNFRRIARLMKAEAEVYNYVKWSVWGYAMCGQRIFTPESVYQWLKANTPKKEFANKGEIDLAGKCPVTPSLCASHKMELPKYNTVDGTRMINMFFETFGVDTEDWSMDFKTGARFAEFERFGATSNPHVALKAAVAKIFSADPDFQNMTCDEAEKKSLENFSDVEKVKSFRDQRLSSVSAQAHSPLINRCIRCHVDNSSPNPTQRGQIPFIPYNDPVALKAMLSKTGYKRGRLIDEITFRIGPHATEAEQMPPIGTTTPEDQEELLDYLRSL